VVVLVFAAAAIQGRARAELGDKQVRAGLADLTAGNQQAVGQLADGARSLRAAHASFTAWWALPARLLPLVGPQARALSTVSGEGSTLAGVASSTAAAADLKSLKISAGAIDLHRLEAILPPLERAESALADGRARVAGSRSGWLIPPIGHRVDAFRAQLDRALADAHTAAAAVRVAPGLLGGNGPRRYFIAFLTPAESRGLGGFMSNYGELTAVDGRITLSRSGRTSDLEAGGAKVVPPLPGPPEYVARYGRFRPQNFMRDIPYSPDFPTVAQVLEEQYPKNGGSPVDGAISVDPFALAALLRLTGPVTIPGFDQPLTADNAADVLLRQQYLRFPQQKQRVDFLDSASRVAFERLTRADLPDPRSVARAFGPAVAQGRLMANSVHPEEQALFRRVGLDGAFPPPRPGDFISLVTQNSANNKIDIFLHREVDYAASFDPASGRVRSTATIRLRNAAPPSGRPPLVLGSGDPHLPMGTNRVYLSFYTPLALQGAHLDDRALGLESQRELGRSVYSAFITIPPGQTVTLRLDLAGRVRPSRTYQLGIAPQPLVNPDALTVEVRPTRGWHVVPEPGPGGIGFSVSRGTAQARLVPDADRVLVARLAGR